MAAVTAAIALGGLAISAYGAYEASQASKAQTQDQTAMVGVQEQENAVRQQAMEYNARRQIIENTRNTIRARAMATNNAADSGASLGSSLQGGYGQISGQSVSNAQGINTALQQGEQLFSLDRQLDQYKIDYAQKGGDLNTANAISGLGKGLTGSAGTLGNLGQTFGPSASQGAFSLTQGVSFNNPFTGGLGRG